MQDLQRQDMVILMNFVHKLHQREKLPRKDWFFHSYNRDLGDVSPSPSYLQNILHLGLALSLPAPSMMGLIPPSGSTAGLTGCLSPPNSPPFSLTACAQTSLLPPLARVSCSSAPVSRAWLKGSSPPFLLLLLPRLSTATRTAVSLLGTPAPSSPPWLLTHRPRWDPG